LQKLPAKRGGALGPTYLTSFDEGFSVSGKQTNVPEFNDCQKIISTDGKYGPLMAVFASDSLSVWNPKNAPKNRALAAVEVLNHSANSTYGPLGIGPFFNCLFMWQDPKQWHAVMVPYGEQQCPRVVDPATITGGTSLEVLTAPNGGFQDLSNFPPVARWEWDYSRRIQLIGVRCGDAWCTIGPAKYQGQAFIDPPAYIQPPTTSPTPENRVRSIKGWYDQQRLADITNGSAVPSSVMGMVFPDPNLASHDGHPEHFKQGFVPVSYVALEGRGNSAIGVLKYYKSKFNFDPVPPGSSLAAMTEIALCEGTWKDCPRDLSEIPQSPGHHWMVKKSCDDAAKAAIAAGQSVWWTRIVSRVTHDTLYRCATRRTHDGVTFVPATARWRWLALDETVWQACRTGCCEVEGDK
jgi:hypothetical protein